jgi:hypothetical protein
VRPTPAPTPTFESIEPALADAPTTTSRRSARPLSKSTPDVIKTDRERPISRWADRSGEKLSIVDDRDQRTEGPSTGRSVSDADDTTAGDDPARYIELARSEGFFIAAKFHSMAESSLAETLWTLNEPFSGMLLVVVTTGSEVVDATLHYNLQTDDAGLQRTPFPEHRDPESKTIYVRETCVESLRDRCRRLRATNVMVREWRVTPAISFLTSAEWESILVADAGTNRGAAEVTDLNNARIAELPAGVRSQFHIRGAGEASA